MHLEYHAILSTGRSIASVQKDYDDINLAASLFPDLGGMWRSVIIFDDISEEERSTTSSTFSSEESFEYHEHSVWNPMLEALCQLEVGVVLGALHDEVAMVRVALACHFSLDLLCDKTSSLPIVNDHVSVRNWPPPSYPHVATACANDISLAAANEPALMQYVLDRSTCFICPFLDLLDTFNIRQELQPQLGILQQSTQAVHSYFLVAQCIWT